MRTHGNKKHLIMLLIFVFVLLSILPLFYMVKLSLENSASLFSSSGWNNFGLGNYVKVLKDPNFMRAYLNSLLVSLITVTVGILVNSSAGFALAKMNFRSKKFFFFMILVSFMVPIEATVISLRFVVDKLRLVDTYLGLILPMLGNGMCIFLFKSHFEEIDDEFMDAARMDGASWLDIYVKIALPMAKGTIAACALVLFLSQWNILFWPLIAANSDKFQTLQMYIVSQISYERTNWGAMLAASILSSVLPVFSFFCLQGSFKRSLSGILHFLRRRKI